MKILNFLTILALFAGIILTSCQKENIDEIIPIDTVYQVDTIDVNPMISQLRTSSGSIFLDCVEIPYPVDLVQLSGSTITINSDAELDAAIMLADSIVDFSYPFDAIVNNQTMIIESIEDIAIALIACGTIDIDTLNSNPCNFAEAHILLFFNGLNIFSTNNYTYKFNYPITLIVEGTQVVLNNDADYILAIGSPSRPKSAQIEYPVSVRQFGRTIVLNNDQDVCDFYNTLDEACSNKPAHIQLFHNTVGVPLSCGFFVDFPVSLTRNGVQLTFQDRDEYLSELDTQGAYDELEIVYPVSVTKVNNAQQVTFNSDNDICDYLDNCF